MKCKRGVGGDKCAFVCPHLRNWLTSSCASGKPPFVVTPFVLQEFCKSKRHRECPYFHQGEAHVAAGPSPRTERRAAADRREDGAKV
jgi:hypothetical protein